MSKGARGQSNRREPGGSGQLGKPGDRLTIMSYTAVELAKAKKWKPRVIVLGAKNRVASERGI